MAKFVFGKPKKSKERLLKRNMTKVYFLNSQRPDSEGYVYVNVTKSPFEIGGIKHPSDNGNEFYRLDVNRRAEYSDNNRFLAECTAGACIRFSTDATAISVRLDMRSVIAGMHHFCDRGVYGIDAYIGTGTDRRYVGGQMQTFADDIYYNSGILNLRDGVKEVMINLPLYGGVSKVEIGFPSGSLVGAPTKRAYAPIGFYGSSITQGGCVSRPANSYANIICRALDADCSNFGFSGSALGELVVAEYIASRPMSCFVMDYDYNAPSVDHLRETHRPFYELIRKARPDLPIVFVTHPYYFERTKADEERISVVRDTYEYALSKGDKLVRFVDSGSFFTKEMRDLYAVDILHPNDLGQMSMAEAIYPVVKELLVK